MNNFLHAFTPLYNRPSTVILQQAWPIIPATFTDAFKLSGQSRKCIACRGYVDVPCRADRSFSSSGFRDGSMVASNAAECCNSIDRPGKWIPNGGRHCERRGRTISLVMETACRRNRQQEKGRYIHKGRKRRTKAEREVGREYRIRKRESRREKGRERERGENLPTYPLLDPLSLFFFHPVEVVNGFLLGDLPRLC